MSIPHSEFNPLANPRPYVYDTNLLSWVPQQQAAAGGSGGGGDASFAEQQVQSARLGATTDAEATADGSIVAILKRLRTLLSNTLNVSVQNATLAVTGTFWPATQPVSGTFWQATQPVSLASVPTHAVTQSGGWTVTANAGTGTLAVSGPLTDAQLRATPVSTSISRSSLTGSAPVQIVVGTSSAVAVAANANRKGLVLVNTSDARISIAFGANAAVLNSGITLDPGASWTMTEMTFTTQAVNAIASSASSVLGAQEFV